MYERRLNRVQRVAIPDTVVLDLSEHLIISNHGEAVFYIVLLQPCYYVKQLVHLCVKSLSGFGVYAARNGVQRIAYQLPSAPFLR